MKYKIRVNSPEHSEEIQKFLFSLGYEWPHFGYEWPHFGNEIQATSMPFLTFRLDTMNICYVQNEDFFNNDLDDYSEVVLSHHFEPPEE